MRLKVLITGSAGFVGRHFVRVLRGQGHRVSQCDIADGRDALKYLFRSGAGTSQVYDLVVHCAAVEPHRAAIDGKPMNLAANLHLDSAMFEWAVRTKQRRVLYLSSPAVYPVEHQTGTPRVALKEDFVFPFNPDANYGWTKLTGERMARMANEVGLPVHVVRPFSGYGEDQSLNFPFPSIVKRARDREDPFTIWGLGTQVRDWVHVEDVISGALEVVEQDVRGPVNLCTGIGTSMRELAEMACAEVGYKPDFDCRVDMPAGVAYRVGDPARMLGIYRPRISVEEGVRRALAR